eukprot:TRINITY_DN1355_c1_g1_i1.p1 TRINITY_DN1355_c1_g1~~TRINITY_DN1355_c1_g1_i1.p1  ORF type:complete len:401 (+),score=77.88 TRINITY_DN1355_c1_g1_i1:41-1204(+)
MITEPESVAPLSALDSLLRKGNVARRPSGTDSDEDDDDDDDEEEGDEDGYFVTLEGVPSNTTYEESDPPVWDRLHAMADGRNRKRDANYLLNMHRNQQKELQHMQSPKKLSTTYQPDLADRRYQSVYETPEKVFPFKPELPERVKLMQGYGKDIWNNLSRVKQTEEEPESANKTPRRGSSTPRKSRDSSPLHNRLYSAKVGNVKYLGLDECTFHPNVKKVMKRRDSQTPRRVRESTSAELFSRLSSPRPTHMAGSHGSPEAAVSGRVSQSPRRPPKPKISFRVTTTGCSIREQPSTESTRYKLLPREHKIMIVRDSIFRSTFEGVWGEAENGWIQIEDSEGNRLMTPEVVTVSRREGSTTPTHNAMKLAATRHQLQSEIDNLPNVYR